MRGSKLRNRVNRLPIVVEQRQAIRAECPAPGVAVARCTTARSTLRAEGFVAPEPFAGLGVVCSVEGFPSGHQSPL